MVADNPQLRQAMQRESSSSDRFATEADSLETTGELAGFLTSCVTTRDLVVGNILFRSGFSTAN